MKPHWMKFAGIAALTVLVAACGGKKEKHKEEASNEVSADTTAAIHVVTTVVQPRPYEDWGLYSADLRGVDDAVLTSPMQGGGRVNSIVEVGTAVSKGQPLCNIESDRYLAQLQQSQAAVDLAKGEQDRAKNNLDKGFVGQAVVDKANLDFESARVALLQARRAYEDSRCQAPFAGVLVSRFLEKFQSAAPGSPTVRVAGLSRLEAVVSIPESEAFDYREGQQAEFQLLQDGAKAIPGKIRSLDRAVESRNRVIMARAEIGNPGNALRPGMIGKVRILRHRYEKALVVASQAVLRLQEGTSIMRVVDGRAEKAAVVLGPSSGDSVVILSGLSAGDRVITVGAFQVSEKTKVAY